MVVPSFQTADLDIAMVESLSKMADTADSDTAVLALAVSLLKVLDTADMAMAV